MATPPAPPSTSPPPKDPSPSPPPTLPIPSTPGPRALALQKLHNEATTHVLKTLSYANFAACFPTPAARVPQSLAHLHEQFTDRLGASMRMNFEQILDERGVVRSLNELDSLVEEARRRKSRGDGEGGVMPHTLPARQLYMSHLAPSLARQSQTLRQRQEVLQAENGEVLQRVLAQRREIEALMAGVENLVEDLEGAVGVLGEEEVERLRAEAREVDEGMRGVA